MKFDNNKLPLFPNSDKYLRENESETDDLKIYSIQENNALTGYKQKYNQLCYLRENESETDV